MPDTSLTPDERAKREQEILASGKDHELIGRIIHILTEIAHLAPSLGRIREILEMEEHPLISTDGAGPELARAVKLMRKAQIGALMTTLRVIVKSQQQMQGGLPQIDAEARARVLKESLGRIGLDDDKGQDVL